MEKSTRCRQRLLGAAMCGTQGTAHATLATQMQACAGHGAAPLRLKLDRCCCGQVPNATTRYRVLQGLPPAACEKFLVRPLSNWAGTGAQLNDQEEPGPTARCAAHGRLELELELETRNTSTAAPQFSSAL
jgi:hypothetical protein